MSNQVVKSCYKQLMRLARELDSKPVMKFILSDIMRKYTEISDKPLPKWFTPELNVVFNGLLDPSLAYFPQKSAVQLVQNRFKRSVLQSDTDKLVSATNNYIELGMEISKMSTKNYTISLLPTTEQTINVDVAYERDKSAYKDLQIKQLNVEYPSDLREGTLLVNYPTMVLSKETYRLLPRDSVLLVTRINEFGLRGLILNPSNVRVKKSQVDSDSVLSFIPRSPVPSVKQYLTEKQEGMETKSHRVICYSFQGLMDRPLVVSNDLKTIQQQTHSTPLQIASFPGEFCLSLQDVMEELATGRAMMLQVNDVMPLVMNATIRRKQMYSNLLHVMGGEWVEIARCVERARY